MLFRSLRETRPTAVLEQVEGRWQLTLEPRPRVQLAEHLSPGNAIDVLLIPDVRFNDEADWIHGRGGYVMRCTGRGGLVGNLGQHATEQTAGVPADEVIDTSGTMLELLDRMKELADSIMPLGRWPGQVDGTDTAEAQQEGN